MLLLGRQQSMSTNSGFNNKTTAEEVAESFKDIIRGRHFIVTGANTGLGKETVRVLAKFGGIITMTTRDMEKGQRARNDILQEAPNASLTVMQLDLSSLASVKSFAMEYIKLNKPLNVLICNAGVMACPRSETKDGLENQFGTNHVGHYYLCKLLEPVIEKCSSSKERGRIVILSSIAGVAFAPKEGILFHDLDGLESYNYWQRYGQSKLANLLHAFDSQKKVKNLDYVSVHPGIIKETELMRHKSFKGVMHMLSGIRWKFITTMMSESKDIPQGSATTIVCALDPKIEGGRYYEDCQVSNRVHEKAFDNELAARLATVTEQILKEKGFD